LLIISSLFGAKSYSGIRIGQFDSTFTNAWLLAIGIAVLVMAWASKIYSGAKSLRLPGYDNYIEEYRVLGVAEDY
jgi:hypothetical protein